MEKLIRKFTKISYVTDRNIGKFLYVCVAAFAILMSLLGATSDDVAVYDILRLGLLVCLPVAYVLTGDDSSVPTMLVMSMFGRKKAEAEQTNFNVKVVGFLLAAAGIVMLGGLVFNRIIGNTVNNSETVYHDANNDGQLNAGEWWGIKDSDGDEHWYREGYEDEHHIYSK